MADTHPADDHSDQQFWDRQTSDELRLDDSEAWRNVVGLLLLIVSVGIALAVLTVFLSS
jgi:hypothetical protein